MREALNILLDPFLWCFAVLYASSALVWRSSAAPRAKRALAIAVLLMTLICTPAAAMLCVATLEHPYPPRFERPPDVTTMIVLGGGTRPPNPARQKTSLSLGSALRCAQAVQLYSRGGPCKIIVSGGKVDPNDPGDPESHAMRAFLVREGVRAEDVSLEDRSRNTYENAREASKLLAATGERRALVVTHAYHLRRALGCFRKQGIEAIPVGCDYKWHGESWKVNTFLPNPDAASSIKATVHEWIGLLWYWLRGWI